MFKLSHFAGFACLAAAMPFVLADTLYVADSSSKSIVASDLDGQNETTAVSGVTALSGDLFGLTSSGSTLYWTLSVSGLVQSHDLSAGTTASLLTSAQPTGVAVSGSLLYWVDATLDALYHANLDGTNIQTVLSNSTSPGLFSDPAGLAVTGSFIYWSDVGTNKIMRANLDGSSVTTLVSGLLRPTSVAVDGTFVYWTAEGTGSGNTGKIQKADLSDGANVQDVLTGLYRPEGLLVTDTAIYWSETATGVGKANLDGSNATYILTDVYGATGLAISAATPAPTATPTPTPSPTATPTATPTVPATPAVAPSLVLTSKKLVVTQAGRAVVKGTASSDATSVTATRGKKVFTAVGTESWVLKAPLKPGRNVFFVVAHGPGGDSVSVKVVVIRKSGGA